ncbi:MAG: hypothetical protein U9M90_04375 [Patescibacteria group bacterium]|nr:hypothetical protein [Patescibacteria group bacterium]
MASKKNSRSKKDQDNFEKINSLQEMIATAERTITSAKQMLHQIQDANGVQKPTTASHSESNGQVIHGTFDGQIMIGEDGRQYPVPANYASKSKLVEGDMLKLTITSDGGFMYKQIGPVERKFLIGVVKQDERGNFVIKTEDKTYKVLLAAATYFKIELGDEVTVVIPRDGDAVWGAVENVVRKAAELLTPQAPQKTVRNDPEEINKDKEPDKRPSAVEKLEKEIEEERKKDIRKESVIDEWIPDIEALKKEAGHPVTAETEEK